MRRVLALLVIATLAQADRDEAIAKLRDAADEEERVAAILEATAYVDKEVIDLIAPRLRDKSLAVKEAAIRALGRMKHTESVRALHAMYYRDKKLAQDENLFTLLLHSIGRQGDVSSLRVLKDHSYKNLTLRSGAARIMSAGNIRAKESVEELLKAWRKSSGRSRRGIDSENRGRFWTYFRVALAVLTGADHGTAQDVWDKWWRDNRRKFKVNPKRPPVDAEIVSIWENYWGEPYTAAGKAPQPDLEPPFKVDRNPSKDTVDWAQKGLRESFQSKDVDEIIAAIENNGGVLHDRIVHEIARGLRSRSERVRMASIFTLGWMDIPSALKQLHRVYRREKSLRSEEGVFTELLKAIGRHGDKSSLRVLASDPYKGLTMASGRARIYGLSRIRNRESIETLIKFTRLGGGSKRGRRDRSTGPRLVNEFRLAMAVLTGVDQGASKEAWQNWWKENKKGFKMSKHRPVIDETLRKKWEAYWGEPY